MAEALRHEGIEVSTLAEKGLAGTPDPDLLAAAVADGCVLVAETVSDFARIAAEHLVAGGHHPGVMVALSSRFSRRPSGIPKLAAAIRALADEQLADRLVYLEQLSE